MAEKETCCTGGNTTLIAACSGKSNVGQIANQVMVEVDKMGGAKSFCLSGVGAGLSGFVESAKAARMIMIDGCPTGCGKKVLEKYEVKPFRYFDRTGVRLGQLEGKRESMSAPDVRPQKLCQQA